MPASPTKRRSNGDDSDELSPRARWSARAPPPYIAATGARRASGAPELLPVYGAAAGQRRGSGSVEPDSPSTSSLRAMHLRRPSRGHADAGGAGKPPVLPALAPPPPAAGLPYAAVGVGTELRHLTERRATHDGAAALHPAGPAGAASGGDVTRGSTARSTTRPTSESGASTVVGESLAAQRGSLHATPPPAAHTTPLPGPQLIGGVPAPGVGARGVARRRSKVAPPGAHERESLREGGRLESASVQSEEEEAAGMALPRPTRSRRPLGGGGGAGGARLSPIAPPRPAFEAPGVGPEGGGAEPEHYSQYSPSTDAGSVTNAAAAVAAILRPPTLTAAVERQLRELNVDIEGSLTKARLDELRYQLEDMELAPGTGSAGPSVLEARDSIAQVDAGIAAALGMHIGFGRKRGAKAEKEGRASAKPRRAGAAAAREPDGNGTGGGGAALPPPPGAERVPGLVEAISPDFTEAQAIEVLQILRDQLQLDVEVPVSAFVILERCLQAPAKRRLLTPTSWRQLLITAVILAAKTWYDEQLWLVDVRHQLRGYFELEHLGRQEAEMCKLVQFRFNVTPKVRARARAAGRGRGAPSARALPPGCGAAAADRRCSARARALPRAAAHRASTSTTLRCGTSGGSASRRSTRRRARSSAAGTGERRDDTRSCRLDQFRVSQGRAHDVRYWQL